MGGNEPKVRTVEGNSEARHAFGDHWEESRECRNDHDHEQRGYAGAELAIIIVA